ncbi:unnamed protein product [Microthlaspi erraticum]|uniref:Uncharacterized protein n=1 Tax=Microthlaspi erraticum TaxID=1685480 RepID=A0A6D2KD29_9BRAS|nr:unnamed protein product [Microthlaspi erraticum]
MFVRRSIQKQDFCVSRRRRGKHFRHLHIFLFLLFVSSSGGSLSGGVASAAFESLIGLGACRSPAFLHRGLTRGGVWRSPPVRFSVVSPSLLSFARQISAEVFHVGVVPTRSMGYAESSSTDLRCRRFKSAASSSDLRLPHPTYLECHSSLD